MSRISVSMPFKRNRLISVFLVFVFLSVSAMAIMPTNSSALIHYLAIPRAIGGSWAENLGAQYSVEGALSYVDGLTTNINPGGVNNGKREFIYTYEFHDYSDFFNMNYTPTVNAEVTKVSALVIGDALLTQGWFSIGFTSNFAASAPWLSGNSQDFTTTGANEAIKGIWRNSTLFPHIDWGTGNMVRNIWDITDLYDWNLSLVESPDLRIMWTTCRNRTLFIDYLGIQFEYYDVARDSDLPIVTEEIQMKSLIWLLVVFAPAIIMQPVAPKIGFIAGMALMLGVLGLSNPDFFPMSLIGFVGVAVLAYKDG